ncbi:MAG: protein phosphatase [Boseongicola sp.]
MAEFSISDLRCGDGWLGIAPIPGRRGDYFADFAKLVMWEPTLVLTMVTTPELDRVGAETLGEDLAALGIKWRHLPIIDLGAPPEDTAAIWSDVSVEAHQILGGGGKVLAHCFGGCGRSGMAIMGLMVEAGEDADPALERLRDARPCAVETESQRAWAAVPMFERLGWAK